MFYAGWQDLYAIRVSDEGPRVRYISELVRVPTVRG
jgi:hypothetical protein